MTKTLRQQKLTIKYYLAQLQTHRSRCLQTFFFFIQFIAIYFKSLPTRRIHTLPNADLDRAALGARDGGARPITRPAPICSLATRVIEARQ